MSIHSFSELEKILNNCFHGVNYELFEYLTTNDLYNLLLSFNDDETDILKKDIFKNILIVNNITFPVLESMINIENDIIDDSYIPHEQEINSRFNLSQIKENTSFIDLNCVAYFGHKDLLEWLMDQSKDSILEWEQYGTQTQLFTTELEDSGFMKYSNNNSDKIEFMKLLKKSGYFFENDEEGYISFCINGTIIEDFLLRCDFHIIEELIKKKFFTTKQTIASLFIIGSTLSSNTYINNDTIFNFLKILNDIYPLFIQENPDLYFDWLIQQYIYHWSENIDQIKYIIDIIQPGTNSDSIKWDNNAGCDLVEQRFENGNFSFIYFIELLEIGMDFEISSLNLESITEMYNISANDYVIPDTKLELIRRIINLPSTHLADKFKLLFFDILLQEQNKEYIDYFIHHSTLFSVF